MGIGLFALLIPFQSKLMGWQISVRKKSMVHTDARSRTLSELLGSFSIIKFFNWETAYLDRISRIRGLELQGVLRISLIKAFNQALALSLPTLAATVSFLVYLGVGNNLNPARIFTALSLFQLLRQPLMFLPRALSAAADAVNALERLEEVFEAETRSLNKIVDPGLDVAVRAIDASFQWLTADVEGQAKPDSKKKKGSKAKEANKSGQETPVQREPFAVEHLNMEVKRGQLVAIVGAVGSGKSSILEGLIGEMRSKGGEVKFGGKVAYCSQTAFIMNGK